MEGRKELLNELAAASEKIDTEIQELQQEIEALDQQAKEYENDFSVQAVDKQQDLVTKRKLYQEALEKAEEHKQSELAHNTDDTVKRAGKIIDNYKAKVNSAAQADLNQVKDHIQQIQKIYDDLNQRDKQANNEVNRFVKEVAPYLDSAPSKEVMFMGEATPKVHRLEQKANSLDTKNYFTVIKGFNEEHFNISGLFPPKKYIK